MQVIANSIVIMFLFISSIMDIKYKKISVALCVIFLILGLGFNGVWCLKGEIEVYDSIVSMLPGVVMVIMSLITKQNIGMGDGIAVIGVGMFVGLNKMIVSLIFGLAFSGVFSLILIVAKKVKKNYEMPFIPFLTLGVCTAWIGGV